MVTVAYDKRFEHTIRKIKDQGLKERVKKQIIKVVENPETGKPMRFTRKDTKEVYVPPFRISYTYLKEENKIIFLELYHKDEQ
jgi:mRNA-degrading endonuclease RelE of RelBE toxin-antitoxin system